MTWPIHSGQRYMFGGSTRKRGFVRETVSKTEKVIAFALLFLIIAIGIAIYVKGQQFDPGLFALDPSLIELAQTDTRESPRLYEPGFGPDGELKARPEAPSSPFAQLEPPGWRQLGEQESFTANTLYEKINGRAEQYIRYGVADMQFVGFTDGTQFIDVFVYNMAQPVQAFGIYSVERTEGAAEVQLGREGYRVEASYFFWKGPYYGQIIASDTDTSVRTASLAVAEKLIDRLGDGSETLWGTGLLPEAFQIHRTLKYFKRDALSLDFLTNAFTARYLIDGGELTAFISDMGNPAEAGQTLEKYSAYIADYGEVMPSETIGSTRLVTGDMGGLFDVVFQSGKYIGGVTLAENRSTGEEMVRNWIPMFTSR
jgi:hypothetical protein